ncbi:insulin-degrading enzyme-like [Choristoneura fumiferana]|uniref:insulin-degrading enzyme-like n=1 Tax=Choristoneura fumiferana TaxID=7141 RepID=UPI003D15BEE6
MPRQTSRSAGILPENEYNKFLSEHGGSSNASTSSDHTTYYFDVLPDYLGKSLDIFAQFFIAPLFTETATGRELSAVNSEHEKNTSSDTWRLDQLNKSTASPDHPYHKFGTGNRETLETIPKEKGIDVRKELLKFHDKWYSANIMALVVTGKESLDELEAMVVPLFSAVEDTSVVAPSWQEHPFPPSLRRKRAYCLPVKDLRSLSIDFPIPDTRKHYKSGPGHYLSHLLGHEGPGSLLSELKARGWCNSLVGGTRIGARGFGFFGVQVDLTENGVEHIDDIVVLVFQYIAMLRATKPQRWVWEEQRDLMAMEFRFKDAQEPRSLVTSHVSLVQEFPMEDVLSAYYLLTEWRPELIDELLDLLTPENVRVGIVAKCFGDKCTQVEPWYGTKYLQEDIDPATIKQWKSVEPIPALHLPPLNEFIPARLELEKGLDPTCEAVAPAIVKDTPLMRLWFKQDNEFKLPKAFLTFDLVSPLAYLDPINCNLTSVWVLLFRDSLQQFAYAAELAGLRWSIGNAKYGISITIDGYDDKQHVLLEKIIEHIVNFKVDPQRFAIMKENHIRGIKNFDAEQPYQHAVYQQALCLSDLVWTRCQLLDAAETITPEMLNEFASRFIRKVHVEGLMFGNLTRERALKIADTVENKLPKDATPLLAQQLLLYREVEIEKGAHYLRQTENSVHKSSCASLYYACGVRATRPNVALELLAQTLSEPCFNVLRTKEQLGYIVFSGVRRSNGVQGLRVIVQSDRHPAYLEQRIEAFLKGAQEYLEEMSEEEFVKHRAALAAQRLERPKRMSTKASQMWSEISAQVYNFDRPRVEVEVLNTINKEELIQFYKEHISDSSKNRQKLSVYIVSTAEGGAGTEENGDSKMPEKEPIKIIDLVEFKSRRRLYAHPAPFITNIPRKGAQCKL